MCRRTPGNPLHGWSKQSSCSSHMGSEGVYTGAKISTLVFAYHVAHNATTECSLGSHLALHALSLQPSLPRDCSWRLVRRAHAPGTRGCGCCAWNPRRPRFSACTTIAGQPPAPLPSVHAHARLRHERQTPRSTHPVTSEACRVVHALRAMPWEPCDAYTHTHTRTHTRAHLDFVLGVLVRSAVVITPVRTADKALSHHAARRRPHDRRVHGAAIVALLSDGVDLPRPERAHAGRHPELLAPASPPLERHLAAWVAWPATDTTHRPRRAT